MANNGNIINKEEYKRVVLEREKEGTTGIGEGIAIPHGKTDAVSKPGLAAMVVPNGVNFDSLDGQPARLIFLIAAPNTKDNVHLDVLSRLSTLLMDTRFREELLNAETAAEFMLCIDRAERMKLNETKKENDGYEILDGKQRLSTIIDFYENRFPYNGVYYNDLSAKDKDVFLNHHIVQGEVREADRKAVLKYFLMLNRTGKSMDQSQLDKVEKMLEE